MRIRQYAVLGFLLGVILVLETYRIFLLASIAVNNSAYSEIINETSDLQKQNLVLKNSILKAESLTEIDQVARARGFIDMRIIIVK